MTDVQATELSRASRAAKDGPTRTRYQAVRLSGAGYWVRQVQEITGVSRGSRGSLMRWCRLYRTQGVLAVCDQRRGGNHAKLSPQERQQPRAYLHRYTPRQLLGTEAATAEGQFWTVPDLKRALQNQKVFASRRESQVMSFQEQLEKTDRPGPGRAPHRVPFSGPRMKPARMKPACLCKPL